MNTYASRKEDRMNRAAGDMEKVEADRSDRLMPGDYRPMKAKTIEQKDLRDGCVLYDAHKGAVYTLNSTASFILTYCDGDSTIEDIARQSELAFGLTPDEAMRDVISMLSFLQEEKLLGPR